MGNFNADKIQQATIQHIDDYGAGFADYQPLYPLYVYELKFSAQSVRPELPAPKPPRIQG